MSKSSTERERVAQAVARLERAVDDLVSVAGERAADYVERATERLQRGAPRRHERYRRSRGRSWRDDYARGFREPAWLWSDKPRSRRLYRDAKDGKILGICAGVARYYGLETWVVRCVAVTALIFFNWMAFVSYIVAYFILDARPAEEDRHSASTDRHSNGDVRAGKRAVPASARRQLRTVHADLDEVELRLRRMETHVTSGQYELQRELAKIGKTR